MSEVFMRGVSFSQDVKILKKDYTNNNSSFLSARLYSKQLTSVNSFK